MAIPNLLLSLLLVSHVILSMPSPSFAACLLPCESEIDLLLYLHQIWGGPDANEIATFISPKTSNFGGTAINDWAILDAPQPNNASIVARATGMCLQADLAGPGWFCYSGIRFKGGRFDGSSINVMGTLSYYKEGQLAIIGGTGQLAMARGVIKYKPAVSYPLYQITRQLDIHLVYTPPTDSTAGTDIL